MDDIIKQLEACHEHFTEYIGIMYEGRHEDERYLDLLAMHKALLERLKAIPTWHMSVDEMAKLTPEGE